MKKLSITTVAAAATLGVVASIGVAAPASAATTYVTADDLQEEGDSYPDAWFTGNPQPEVAPISTDAGLVLTGQTQLLRGGAIDDPDLSDLVDDTTVVATGEYTFQIPVFLNSGAEGDEDLQFTTLRPAVQGSPSTETQWTSSRSVGNYVANAPISFNELEEKFAEGDSPAVLAYGVFVDAGQSATLQSVTLGDDTSIFTPPPIEFNDIATNTFRSQIEWLVAAGITTGYDNGNGTFSYRPSEAVLREQMAAFLYRYQFDGANPAVTDPISTFKDVAPTFAFTRHIAWLAEEGITEGYTDNTFRGSQPVLREQMAAFLYRLADEPAVDTSGPSPFKDVPKSATFYKQIVWLEGTGITEGYTDDTFRGSQPVLREQMAAFLQRFDEYQSEL